MKPILYTGRYEVFRKVKIQVEVFWVVTPQHIGIILWDSKSPYKWWVLNIC